MARPREFDTDATQERMMRAFWTRGYEATSIDDLCHASGLSKSSLYATFGDKHALLLQSLERYIDMRVDQIRAILEEAKSLKSGLTKLAGEIIDDVVAGPGRRGCFIGNCAAEIARTDHRAMGLIRNGLIAMEEVYAEAVQRARARGDITEMADVRALSRFLNAGFQGLRLIGKADPDRARLQDIATTILRCAT